MANTGMDILKGVGGEQRKPPVAELLGWELLEIEPGRVKVQYEAGRQFLNPMGNVQGGILGAMLDDVMGPAAFTTVDEGQFVPTLEFKVSFLRPAKPGTLIAEGRLVHRTKSVAYVEGDLRTVDGEIVAKGTATLRVTMAELPELQR